MIGYQRKRHPDHEVLARQRARPARRPHLITRAVWYVFDDGLVTRGPGSTRPSCPAPSTPRSTPPSASCPCSRSATAGTSAVSRRRGWPTPAPRPSSSTTLTPAARGSPSSAFDAADRHLAATLDVLEHLSMHAAAARAACSRRSAETATSRSTRRRPAASSRPPWPRRPTTTSATTRITTWLLDHGPGRGPLLDPGAQLLTQLDA